METKEMKITPPEGYEIDRENSTFECIKFKKKKLTYLDIAIDLFVDSVAYFTDSSGNIISYNPGLSNCMDGNVGISKKQLKKLLAINKLMNVAKYLNGDWKPDWNDRDELKFYIIVNPNTFFIDYNTWNCIGATYFKSRELAQQAIDILGEDTIRLALSTDW